MKRDIPERLTPVFLAGLLLNVAAALAQPGGGRGGGGAPSGCTRGTDGDEEGKIRVLPEILVRGEVDRTEATPYEDILFTLVVDVREGVEVEIPEAGAGITGLRIVDFGTIGPTRKEGRVKVKKWYKLRGDIAGSYIIPGVTVRYREDGREEKEASTEKIFIEIKGGKGEGKPAGAGTGMTDIMDIKGIVALEGSIKKYTYSSIALLVLLGLVTLFILLKKRRGRKRTIPVPRPEEKALSALLALKGEGLHRSGRFREFYYTLSEVLRRYIEERLDYPASRKTSLEILREFDIRQYPGIPAGDMEKGFRNFTLRADIARYAKGSVESETAEDDLEMCIGLVKVPVDGGEGR